MAKIGILTMSDGRDFVHEGAGVGAFAREVEDAVAGSLKAAGHEVVRAREVVWTNRLATTEARRVADERPDLTIFNIPVWAFPHFSMLAADATPGPLSLFSNLDPGQPGMVGMLAAGGALDQIGRHHLRAWGDVSDPDVLARLEASARAARAVSSLRGSTFGRIGGRPMGMYTAVANPDQWMEKFGVDVEEIDQWELVRRSEAVDGGRARRPRVAGGACGGRPLRRRPTYSGEARTPDPHLPRHARADRRVEPGFLRHQGPARAHDPLLHHGHRRGLPQRSLRLGRSQGSPRLRHRSGHGRRPHHADPEAPFRYPGPLRRRAPLPRRSRGIWDLCNSGQHATWFAARCDVAEENLSHVHLYPEEFFFPAGGAAVHHLAAGGDFTFARLTRLGGRYRMQAMRGAFERYDKETNEELMGQSTYAWPHAFARMDADADEILSRYGSNHIHAIPGDHVQELKIVCRLLDVDYDGFGSAR